MRLLGAHMSVAGGYDKAVKAAASLGMTTFQMFTHSPSQWSVKARLEPPALGTAKKTLSGKKGDASRAKWVAKPLETEQLHAFKAAMRDAELHTAFAHDSYLINLGTTNDELWEKSIAAFIGELEKAEALGLKGVVTHPGAHGEATPGSAMARVAKALDLVHKATKGFQVKTLIETTAGQGTTLGWQFEQIGEILGHLKDPDRVGICLDTCHMFAAGYAYEPKARLEETVEAMQRAFGTEKIALIHTNDSLKDSGSRVDRHAHIGQGKIGLAGIRSIVNHPKLIHVPLILETPKDLDEKGRPMDEVNLEVLRTFCKGAKL